MKTLMISFLTLLLAACGGGGGGGGGDSNPGAPTPENVAGTWNVVEQIDDSGCGGTGDSAQYQATISQDGASITVVTPAGTFQGSVTGNTINWSGQYYDATDAGWVTITSLSLTINGDSLNGTARWDFRESQNGPVVCSGTTVVTATRTSGVETMPNAPSGLSAQTQSASSIRLNWADNATNEADFRLERSLGSANSFHEIAIISPNATTYTDTNLSASTTYYYQLRARNGAGFSGYSNIASATTSPPSTTSPAAPTNLRASASSATRVVLSWTDVATNESGYRVARSENNSTFATVADNLPANSTSYTDTSGLRASTTYYYRVYAYNSAGSSHASASVATPAPSTTTYTLTVSKSGTGSGVVSGTGINCGSDCTETVAAGTSITLTAQPASGSTFGTWTNCDSASGTSCTVTLNANRTVNATFNPATTSSITVSLPTNSTTGSYTLSWTVTGLAQAPWTIQESPNTSFSNPAIYRTDDNTSPFEYAFTNKPNGFYCYRVSYDNGWSQPACITVARNTSAVLKVTNNSKYDLVDLRINNRQYVSYPNPVPPGQSISTVFDSSGTVQMSAGVGFFNTDGTRNIWFTYGGNVTLTVGQTQTVPLDNPTIAQLLSGFASSRNWDGVYYCYACNNIVQYARFNFTSSGGYTFYRNGVRESSGTVQLVSWPQYASIVTFRLCTGSSCGENIQLPHPFSSFLHRSGSPDWPIVEYIAQ